MVVKRATPIHLGIMATCTVMAKLTETTWPAVWLLTEKVAKSRIINRFERLCHPTQFVTLAILPFIIDYYILSLYCFGSYTLSRCLPTCAPSESLLFCKH